MHPDSPNSLPARVTDDEILAVLTGDGEDPTAKRIEALARQIATPPMAGSLANSLREGTPRQVAVGRYVHAASCVLELEPRLSRAGIGKDWQQNAALQPMLDVLEVLAKVDLPSAVDIWVRHSEREQVCDRPAFLDERWLAQLKATAEVSERIGDVADPRTGDEARAVLAVFSSELEAGGELSAYAAQAATGVLIENWVCAVNDGSKLDDLLPDVDQVIARLQQFKQAVLKRNPAVLREALPSATLAGDEEDDEVIASHEHQRIYYTTNRHDMRSEFWYRDADSGNEFDIRDLPTDLLGAERDEALTGDDDAARVVLERALKAGYFESDAFLRAQADSLALGI